jgi:hypothetical protein
LLVVVIECRQDAALILIVVFKPPIWWIHCKWRLVASSISTVVTTLRLDKVDCSILLRRGARIATPRTIWIVVRSVLLRSSEFNREFVVNSTSRGVPSILVLAEFHFRRKISTSVGNNFPTEVKSTFVEKRESESSDGSEISSVGQFRYDKAGKPTKVNGILISVAFFFLR